MIKILAIYYLSTITGEFSTDGSDVSQGLAYNKAKNDFWVGGWFHNAIYHVDSQGNTLSKINTAGEDFHDITGLAWHPNGNGGKASLFAIARSPNMIYEFNPESGELIQSFPTYNNISMNALSIGEDGSLWTASMGETSLYNIASGIDNNTSLPVPSWLSVDIDSGLLVADQSLEITLTFDAHNMPLGNFHAQMIIEFNTDEPAIIIPINMTIKGLMVENYNTTHQEISVYPNPCEEMIQVNINKTPLDWIKIYDATGKCVKLIRGDSATKTYSVNIKPLKMGVHFIQCLDIKGCTHTSKFIKK